MALDQDVVNLAKAIRQVESGNRAVLPQEKGIGGASRYQYTTSTWQGVAQKYLGDANAPLTLENENKATYLRIKDWKDAGYTPDQIASMWNAGEGRPNAHKENMKGVNAYGVAYDVPAYVNKVYAEYQKQKQLNPPQPIQPITPQVETTQVEKPGLLKSIGGALISSEKGLGESLGQSVAYLTGMGKKIDENNKKLIDSGDTLLGLAKTTTDPVRKQNLINQAKQSYQLAGTSYEEVLPAIQKTGLQIAGEGLGTALDVATAGTYGNLAKGAKTGQLLTKSQKVANIAEKAGIGVTKPLLTKTAVPNVLKQVGTGAGIGYGYDVAGSLQAGETGADVLTPGLGTVIGAAAPLAIKGVSAGVQKVSQATPELAKTRLATNLNEIFDKAPQSVRKQYTAMQERGIDAGKVISDLSDTMDNFIVDNERLKFGTGIFDKIDEGIVSKSSLLDDAVKLYPDTIITKDNAKKIVSKIINEDKDLIAQARTKQVEKQANRIIDGYYANKNVLDLSEIHNYKKGAWQATKKFKTAGKINSSDAYYEIGKAFRKIVEDEVPDIAVKNINKEIGQLEELYKFLNKINTLQGGGITLKGGKLGKYASALGSGIAGAVIGTTIGGPLGGFLLGAGSTTVASLLRKLSQKSSILGSLDRLLIRFVKEVPPSESVKAAQEFINAVKNGIKKPEVTPSVVKGFEEMREWVQKNYSSGKLPLLPEAKSNTPRAAIELPQMTETARQASAKSSGILPQKSPTILPIEKGIKSPSDLRTTLPIKNKEYLYHGTNEDVLEDITKEGLKPMSRGSLSLSKTEDYAKSFAKTGITPKGKTSPVLLRVKNNAVKTYPSTSGVQSDKLNELLVNDTIAPENIEIFKEGKWKPLKSTKLPTKKSTLPQDPLIQEAKGKTLEEFVKAQTKQDYRSAHQLSLSDSITADKIDIPTLKEAIRTRNGYLNNYNLSDLKKLEKLQGNPDADVKIFRASPKNELNDGDWVTTDKTYANDIKRQNGGKVYEYTVKVKDLRFPKDVETLPSLSMASTFSYSPKTSQLTDIWNKENKLPKKKN